MENSRQTPEELSKMYSGILDSFPGMAYRSLYDSKCTLLYASSGCLELTGWKIDDLILNHAKSFCDLILKEDLEILEVAKKDGIQANRSFEAEYRIETSDGRNEAANQRASGLQPVWKRGGYLG